MNNSLLIGLLIALVISMILYVQYHANNSVEQFAETTPSPNLNTKFLNCKLLQDQNKNECFTPDNLKTNAPKCQTPNQKIAFYSKEGGIFDDKDTNKCVVAQGEQPYSPDNTCSDNEYRATCADPIVNNTDYLETNGLCKLSEPVEDMSKINPDDDLNNCDKDSQTCPPNTKAIQPGMYDINGEYGDKIYTPCQSTDNDKNITSVIVTDCNSE